MTYRTNTDKLNQAVDYLRKSPRSTPARSQAKKSVSTAVQELMKTELSRKDMRGAITLLNRAITLVSKKDTCLQWASLGHQLIEKLDPDAGELVKILDTRTSAFPGFGERSALEHCAYVMTNIRETLTLQYFEPENVKERLKTVDRMKTDIVIFDFIQATHYSKDIQIKAQKSSQKLQQLLRKEEMSLLKGLTNKS